MEKPTSRRFDNASRHVAGSAPADISGNVEEAFLRAEHTGLRFAIIGRTVALALLGIWLVGTRVEDPARAYGYLFVLLGFAGLGLTHYFLIASRFDRVWIKFVFITVDIAIVSALVATQPLFESASDLPPAMIFRSSNFPFYFVILGFAALSFSPGMVLWSGIAGALGWIGAFLHVTRDMSDVRDWGDIPPRPTAGEVMNVVLDPAFAGFAGRIQEAVLLVVVALLIGIAMWRARKILRLQLAAEQERSMISGIFGRYVPQTIVDAMIEGHGTLAPVEREATVLFADIAGFTAMTERVGPVRTVEILNAYFDAVNGIVGSHHGVVTQFQGDGFLAMFNVPVEDPAHARNALNTAREILTLVLDREFSGESIRVRIGINTGVLVAGNVGGGGRQSYTVYGGTVNLAARLEALCKEYDTSLLLSATTAKALPQAALVAVGDVAVRGLAEPVAVYSVAAE